MGKNPFSRLFRKKESAPETKQASLPEEKRASPPKASAESKALADLEWELLRSVKLEKSGGEYMMMREDFDSERLSIYETWPDELLESRRKELAEDGPALLRQRKILTFRDSDPDQYELLKGEIPAVSEEKKQQIREIVDTELAWAQESMIQLPDTWRREPSLDREKATAYGEVSFETGLEAELMTYGDETLRLYRRMVDECKEQNVNLLDKVLDNKARWKGFMSAQALEAHIRRSYATPC